MKYEEFVANVKECIEKREGKDLRIHFSKLIHNNGTFTDSISLLSQGENITPAISLEPFYQMAVHGAPIGEIVDQILQYYNRYRRREGIDVSFFTDYSRSRDRIVCRLVHCQKNKDLLARIPHMRFLDLAVVYYYLLEGTEFEGGTILIENSHLNMWGVSPGEFHDRALKNTSRLLPHEFITMSEMIGQLTGIQMSEEEPERYPMYVLTNTRKSFGAVYMLFGNILEEIAEKIGEDYYLLPGSVHECILVPVSVDMDEEELQCMVQEINKTQVEPEELLSNSVYRYYRSGKCLCIAREGASI